ncbi:MAG TPA: hypothetical protein VF407_13630 [Polyangiaceae bacterium]
MSSRPFVFVALASAILVGACATGTVASTAEGDGEDQGTGGDASTTKADSGGGNAYGNADSGGGLGGDGGLEHKDSGSTPPTPIDSGTTTPPVVDSGTTPTASFCTGETGSKKNDFNTKKYDDWCDESAYYGYEFDCSDNSDCTGNFTSSYEPECCYKPIATGYCNDDFGGIPQCVPK